MNIKKNVLAITISASLLGIYSQSSIARPLFDQGQQGQQQQGQQQQRQQGDRQQGQQGTPDAASILTRMDYDEDGSVTVDDFINRSLERAENHYDRMDSDEDGVVSEEEFTSRKPRKGQNEEDSVDRDAIKQCIEEATGISLNERPTAAEAFVEIDVDADSFVSWQEFLNHKESHAEDRFAELDSDANEVISEEEVEADLSERESIRTAHQTCVSEQLLLDESSSSF